MPSDYRDRLRLRRTQALPRQARDEPVELLAAELDLARILARPGEAMDRQHVQRCMEQVAAYRASGLKAKAWAEANGVPLGTLGS